MEKSKGFKGSLSVASSGLGILCAIHCLAMPLLMAFLPGLGHFMHNPAVEITILATVLATGLWVLIRGYSDHGKHWPLTLFSVGFACFLVHLFFGHDFEYMIILGAILLVAGHVWNFILHRKSPAHTDCCEA